MGFLSTGIEPSLIHAIDIRIERLDRGTTTWDPVFGEPDPSGGGKVYLPPVDVLAQIHWSKFDFQHPGPGGDDPMADGHITMLRSDVDALADGPFKKGDRIIMLDGDDRSPCPLYFIEPSKAGHYRTAKLWKFEFLRRMTS